MLYIKTLEFEEKPNYEMIRGKFKQALQRLHLNKKDEILTDWQIDRKLKREEKKQQIIEQQRKIEEEQEEIKNQEKIIKDQQNITKTRGQSSH